MIFNNTKEICKFIRDCAKMGVTNLKIGDLSFELDPTFQLPFRQTQSPRNDSRAALAIEQEGEQQLKQEEDELDMSQLVVDDPERFEEESIKLLKGE